MESKALPQNDTPLSCFIVNIDYYGGCAGHCQGCFIPEVERKNQTVYFNEDTIKKNLDLILAQNKNQWNKYTQLVLALNRGNFLTFDLDRLKIIFQHFKSFAKATEIQNIKVELSTSLIGKLGPQIEQAKTLIKLANPLNLSFALTANPDLLSKNYWQNLDTFLLGISEHRGGGEESGDILNVIVASDSLPDSKLWNDFTHYKFPVNLIVVPFTKKATDEQITSLSDFILKTTKIAKEHKMDLNVINVSGYTNQFSNGGLLESLQSQNHASSAVVINKNGELKKGHFSVFGDIDFLRMKEKIKRDFSEVDIAKKFLKNKYCQQCQFNAWCVRNSGHYFAAWNMDMISNHNQCLSGLEKTLDYLDLDHK